MRLTLRRKPWPALFERYPIPWHIESYESCSISDRFIGALTPLVTKISDIDGNCIITERGIFGATAACITDVWSLYMAAAAPYLIDLSTGRLPGSRETFNWTPQIVEEHPLPWTLHKAYVRPDGTRRIWLTDVHRLMISGVEVLAVAADEHMLTLLYDLSVIVYSHYNRARPVRQEER
jgi:hypothetical protein